MNNVSLNKDYILSCLSEHQQKLKQFGVRRIGLFGSFVKERAGKNSDVDLLVDFISEKRTLKNIVELGDYLETLFNRKVEIVTPEGLSKYIGPHILKDVKYAPFEL